jgi:hypothetical protein
LRAWNLLPLSWKVTIAGCCPRILELGKIEQ